MPTPLRAIRVVTRELLPSVVAAEAACELFGIQSYEIGGIIDTEHIISAFVAHARTEAYEPGKVIDVDGEHRRVRFVYFVATIRAADLRAATAAETVQVREWLQQKQAQHGGQW